MKLYLNNDFPWPIIDHKQQHRLAYRMLETLLDDAGQSGLRPYQFVTDEYGKPALSGTQNLYFNISHCTVCVAVVFSDKMVGIDTERRFAWNPSLAGRISTEKELKWIRSAENEGERAARLNRLWCRKESYLKCLGIGLRTDLRTIQVMGKGPELKTDAGCFHFVEFQNSTYTLCICEKQENNIS